MYNILLVIISILVCIAVPFLMFGIMLAPFCFKNESYIAPIVLIVVGVLAALVSILLAAQRNQILNTAAQTYSIYLNGEEVQDSEIDLNQYKISIDDAEEIVYLTGK